MERKLTISIYSRADIEVGKEEDFVRETDLLKENIEKQLEKISVFTGEIEIEEYPYEEHEKCEGCGQDILEGEAVIKGENRHSACS
jgi:hypothetical protein